MVIVLSGPDLYRSHQRLGVLRDAFRKKFDASGLGVSSIDAMTDSPAQLRTALTTSGFFSAKQFVAIDHFSTGGTITADVLNEALTPLVDVDDVIVVLRTVTAPKKRAPSKKIKSKKNSAESGKLNLPKAKSEVFELLSGIELRQWIISETKNRGGSILPAAADQLALVSFNDTWRISNELDKISSYVGKKPIEVVDIQEMTQSPYTSNIFAVTDALGQGQSSRAVALVHRELAAGTHPLVLVATIAQHVRTLLMVQAAQKKSSSPAAIATATGLHPYVVQKCLSQTKLFSAKQLEQWHHRLVRADATLKSAPLEGEALIDVILVDRG